MSCFFYHEQESKFFFYGKMSKKKRKYNDYDCRISMKHLQTPSENKYFANKAIIINQKSNSSIYSNSTTGNMCCCNWGTL